MVSPEFDIRPSILVGDTADVYLQRTLTILRNEGINPAVTMEFFPGRRGVVCGIREVRALLSKILPETGTEVWALDEGVTVEAGEVALRIRAPYGSLGMYETTICGVLASCSGWAAAARECVEAAQGVAVVARRDIRLGSTQVCPGAHGEDSWRGTGRSDSRQPQLARLP